jgi:4-amino-4-deoxy-L-arabinose transferase-like glycosyltransferase
MPKMAIVHNTFKLQVLANQQGGSQGNVVSIVEIHGVDGKKVPFQMLELNSGWERQSTMLVSKAGQEASLKYEFLGIPGQSIRVSFNITSQSRQILVRSNGIEIPVDFPEGLKSTPKKISMDFVVKANPAIGEHLKWIVLSSLVNLISIGFLVIVLFMGLALFIQRFTALRKKYPWIDLAPIAILAVFMFWPNKYPYSPDVAYYLSLAKNLYHGKGYVHPDLMPDLYRGPVFPFLISFSYMILGEAFRNALILERIFWVLTIFMSYLLGKRLFNPRVGFLAALFVITTGIINQDFNRVWVDGIMVFVVLALQVIMWEVFIRQRGTKWYVLMGLLMGTAYLLKQTSIFIYPLPLLLWAIFKEYRTRQTLLKLLLCYGIFACFLFGWMGYIYLAGGSPGQIAGDFQKGLSVLSYFQVSFSLKKAAPVLATQGQSIKSHLLSILAMISTYYQHDIANYIKIGFLIPIALLFTSYQAIFKKTKPDIFLGIGLLLFMTMIPVQTVADLGFRQDLYLHIIGLVLISAMLDRIFNLFPLSNIVENLLVWVSVACLVFLQVSPGIKITFSTNPNINPQTLGYFSSYTSTAAWIDANIKPDEKILINLRDGNTLHILTAGNRTFDDINTCVGENSKIPAKRCSPPYIAFWVYKGTTDPDGPRNQMWGISEPALISTIRQKDIRYVIVTPAVYYLYYYLKAHPDFEQVTHLNNNMIFRVIQPVQPLSSYPNVKWETCVGKGTPEFLNNLYQIFPARYETMLRDQFEPWMGLSSQDMTTFKNWQGCEFESVYPGTYSMP